jgi:hypothetical protein
MGTKTLPLKELSIDQLYNSDKATFEVPIYQRNYAWGKDEISALIQDVYDAYAANKQTYFIGTLVSFHKGDQVYEVIDGQQRLTTVNLILRALGIPMQNKLTYRARKKSNDTFDTLQKIPSFDVDEKDFVIVNGFKYAKAALREVVLEQYKEEFKKYFLYNVKIIHYQVPKNIDLNHYFEIMNSRGEQLEKHEIIKARLIEKLNHKDKATFNRLWEFCSNMNVYIQQKYADTTIFGKQLCEFKVKSFDDLPSVDDNTGTINITVLIDNISSDAAGAEDDKIDTFQPIIDFSNFLLVVLKLTRMNDENFISTDFNLDDKELIKEFDKVQNKELMNSNFVKRFGFNLLKAKYLLDNYLVHHSNEDDTVDSNPWKLQYWQKEGKKGYLKNFDGENDVQHKLVQLLSLFEVSFTAKQRKNYLFYCLLYLFNESWDVNKYFQFVSNLADKYFYDVYLEANNLNEINIPKPRAFDSTILVNNELDIEIHNDALDFKSIYGDGMEVSKGIPLFIFNYLDYKLWEKYASELRGEKTKEDSKERKAFFNSLGCGDFGLKVFEQFYFSRTRRSLEHYYPQANVTGEIGALTKEQINCLGNYAMIGSETNSSGSNWSPKAKLDHYLDISGKIKQVSVASIKFRIMMKICEDNHKDEQKYGKEWMFEDISAHQDKMLNILNVQ